MVVMNETPVASTAVTPTPPQPAALAADAKASWQWLTHHLVSLAIVGVLVLASVYGVESLMAKHDAATASRDAAILAAQVQQTKDLIAQFRTDEAQRDAQNAQLQAQYNTLVQQMAARNQATAAQAKVDATLSAQDAALRLSQQTHATPGEVVANGNTVSLDLPITRDVVSSLDLLPTVQANLADTQTQLAGETKIAANAQADTADAKGIIASQAETIKKSDAACQAQIKSVKADARKRNWKYFLFGGAVVEGIRIYLTHSI